MDSETWMNANKAVELGFADGILYAGVTAADSFAFAFSARAAANAFLNKITADAGPPGAEPPASENRIQTEKPPSSVPAEQLRKRLDLLKV